MKFEKYVTRPVEIEAVQYVGDIIACLRSDTRITWKQDGDIAVRTLDGDDTCSVGDYIVRGTQGELYVVKEELFLETHDRCDNCPRPRPRVRKAKEEVTDVFEQGETA